MTVTLPELQRDEGTGLYLRVGRGEEGVVKEQRSYWGRTEITVPTIRLSDLLAWHGPDVLKIDIEGGEYGLAGILGELPPCVKAVAVEFHFLSDPSYLAQAEAMVASFLASGFTEVRAAPLTKTHWRHHYAALGCYVR